MALTKNTAAKFEAPADDQVEEGGAEEQTETPVDAAEKPAEAAAKPAVKPAATSASTSVAAAPSSAVASTIMSHDPLAAMENALVVQYDTLTQIMATNGNISLKESGDLLGTHVGLEIISYQDHWVCSPGGDAKDEESKEFLKFSDDGKYVRGTDELLTDAVKAAREGGYPKADIKQRIILVGALVFPGKDKKGNVMDELQDELVQIDLAPRSRGNFLAYRANVAFKVSRGTLDPNSAKRVKMFASVQNKGKNNWTDADFKVLTDADMA